MFKTAVITSNQDKPSVMIVIHSSSKYIDICGVSFLILTHVNYSIPRLDWKGWGNYETAHLEEAGKSCHFPFLKSVFHTAFIVKALAGAC